MDRRRRLAGLSQLRPYRFGEQPQGHRRLTAGRLWHVIGNSDVGIYAFVHNIH
jgi:hypothetical protein